MSGPDRAAVVASLRGLLGEDAVLTEPHELVRYEQGWRYGRGSALAAVRPSRTEDVARVLALALSRGIRVVPQGANTGLVGASTPDESGEMLVLSLERLSRLLDIDAVDRTVTAGGGVLLSQLDAALGEKGLMFPIDLGADPTVGGMVATNAGGTRLLRYGDVRQNLLGLEVVLADGTVLDLMTALRKNNTGLDAKQIFVGTSGVFGVVTRAVLRAWPRPAFVDLWWLPALSLSSPQPIYLFFQLLDLLLLLLNSIQHCPHDWVVVNQQVALLICRDCFRNYFLNLLRTKTHVFARRL